MNNGLKYADLHVHTTLKPFLNHINGNYGNIWTFSKTNFFWRSGKARTSVSQMIDGGVKIFFPALGAIESGWQVFKQKGRLPHLFRNYGDLFTFILNINFARITDNFALLVQEADFLKSQDRPPINIDQQYHKYRIVFPHSKSEFSAAMNRPTDIIAFPTVEGAHALLSGTVSHEEYNIDTQQIISNIKALKQHALRPLFITFSHHFFNSLAGHAHSIYGLASKVLDQSFGLGNPIGPDGWIIIRCLLGLEDQCQQWPILIDTKHFSLAARRQYFDFIAHEKNYSIPVINSHAAYSGSLTIENVIYNNPPFSHNQTNISGEEVYHIWRSRGLIGINMDEKVLWQGEKIPLIRIIAENIMGMVRGAVEFASKYNLPEVDQTIWDIFCIGSDYDGFIDPLDSYPSPLTMPQLEKDLHQEFAYNPQYNKLHLRINAQELTQKIMYKNINDFLLRWLP